MHKTFFPDEFLEKYCKIMGQEFDEFLEASRTKIPKSIWVNSLKISPKELKEKLEDNSWSLREIPFSSNGFDLIEAPQKPGQCEEFQNGLFNLQEKSSMIPAIALNPLPGERVLDGCAAPGNKSLQLACLMQNKGELICVEKSRERMKSLKFNLQKFGLNCAKARLGDLLEAEAKEKFDKILLDVPCSSEGLVRKEFDALKEWSQKLVERKSELQKKLVLKGFDLLKEKGMMVYSTCSLSPEENEEVVNFLLKKRANAQIIPIQFKGIKLRQGLIEFELKNKKMEFDSKTKNCARIYPQDNNSQAFFFGLIEKK